MKHSILYNECVLGESGCISYSTSNKFVELDVAYNPSLKIRWFILYLLFRLKKMYVYITPLFFPRY